MTMWLAVSLIGFLYVTGMATFTVAAYLAFESEADKRPRPPVIVALCAVWPFLMAGVLIGAVVSMVTKESGK
ncbi:hypothetical protein GN330_22790 [Nitratireductor sp. CAU 1489]|uniref:Uncharacterized protein n=1 Tax=Nitratireductor arenosus TaxID=2682096 RepID=A0A844QJL0_9HYPH|nr:hypothetical protein [Nitratireductor arenosus]MVB00077.1 hypothetical protein [Nitratireductor arenosus]